MRAGNVVRWYSVILSHPGFSTTLLPIPATIAVALGTVVFGFGG